MVTLYRQPGDPWADEIEEALREMVIAHEVEHVEDADALPEVISELPALHDDEVVTGASALRSHLQTLRALMADWNRFQSDACYVEDDGSIC
ncbi:uroporphyrinogen-III synthase [Salinibacter ruber]|uniref:hypothetical protein n=1 Tax=Salinibacter ruber TaxID=146919 RepID=UPI000E58F28C|nr:hypothetical protein [Salinibacter ruber]MCS3628885.1 uroporphyrinogen-III synthase [Salinibacter ruber]MCS3667092.1 uroporphyrinogen-III synthase [Salinibacter ruber]MCS3827362.1 uroporphyrinogen-III synthase [Salinibacter ruber]MCS4145794.1 uroporphyrinogen-III synthase [Salinibacter ruber]